MASYPPPYQGTDWKAQRRAMKAQARIQRNQIRMQQRSLRRGSMLGPLLLVGLGVTFLLVELGRLDWWVTLDWLNRWWPVLLIAAGVVMLAEWAIDQHVQRTRAEQGLPPTGSRIMGGGVIWLMVFVVMIVAMSHAAVRTRDWNSDHFRFGLGDWDRALGEPHDSDDSMNQAIPADGVLTIDNPQGDVTVTGTSDDGQMHIAIHKQVFSFKDEDAGRKAAELQPSVSNDGGRFAVNVPSIEGAHADLTIDIPHGVALTVTADRGDVRVSGLHAAVSVNANHGNVDLSGLTGAAATHMHSDNASFSAHSVTGAVSLDGRAGDINVSDVHGDVELTAAAFGETHLERIDGGVHFQTHRTDFQIARLDGEVDLSTGADLSADQVLGPVLLKTSDRNISLERVQGNVNIANTNGSVVVTSASPLGSIEVKNRRGSVDVGVPPTAGFAVQASTRHGSVENDFDLPKTGSDDDPELKGTVGRGGPTVSIDTTDGDVTLRKSMVEPLPPTPPAPPKLTMTPAAPTVPAPPKVVKVPKAHKAPVAPPAPAALKP